VADVCHWYNVPEGRPVANMDGTFGCAKGQPKKVPNRLHRVVRCTFFI